MKVCTICKIDKDENQYEKYWHSTQKKNRIRLQCTECFYKQKNERRRLKRKEVKLIQVSIRPEIIQPVQPELQPDLSSDKNYKQCRTCQQFKFKTEYYSYSKTGKKSFLDCRICVNKKEVDRARKDRIEYLEENGGSLYRKENPGEWVDDYQKQATYNILKAIGWKLNEDNGIWWKDGIKTSDGVFINIKTKPSSFKNYPKVINTFQKKKIFDKAVELRKQGKSYKDISNEVGLSDTTILNWLNYKE
jgi:hypothetical protein